MPWARTVLEIGGMLLGVLSANRAAQASYREGIIADALEIKFIST